MDGITLFSGASRIEGVHPLQFGFVRRKIRTQRRYGMKIVNPLIFYPWRAYDFTRTGVHWWRHATRYNAIKKRVRRDPAAKTYRDLALTPVSQESPEMSGFVEAFADKIPHTHGAPVRPGKLSDAAAVSASALSG